MIRRILSPRCFPAEQLVLFLNHCFVVGRLLIEMAAEQTPDTPVAGLGGLGGLGGYGLGLGVSSSAESSDDESPAEVTLPPRTSIDPIRRSLRESGGAQRNRMRGLSDLAAVVTGTDENSEEEVEVDTKFDNTWLGNHFPRVEARRKVMYTFLRDAGSSKAALIYQISQLLLLVVGSSRRLFALVLC